MVQESLERVGVVGLGNIGFPIAETLVNAGFSVTAHDIREEPREKFESVGGTSVESPAEVAEASQIVHILVATEEQVDEVIFDESGVLSGFESGGGDGVIIINCTILPQRVVSFAERTPDEVTVVDAAVSGGSSGAKTGSLAVMVGGDETDENVAFVEPALEAIAKQIYYLGELGAGLVAKITNNSILYAGASATLEALEVGEEYGIDRDQLLEIYGKSTGNNYFVQNYHDYLIRESSPLDARGRARRYREITHRYLTITRDLEISVPVGGVVSQEYPELVRETITRLEND